MTIKKVLFKYLSLDEDALVVEFKNLFITKKAITPVMIQYVDKKVMMEKIRSSMFVKEKVDGMGVFEKLKVRLVADGRGQDRIIYDQFISQLPHSKRSS